MIVRRDYCIFSFLLLSSTYFCSTIRPVKLSYGVWKPKNVTDVTKDTGKCPLVIMHGLLGSKHNWIKLSKSIYLRSNHTSDKVFTLDARNHGISPQTLEFDYPSLVEDVRFFMTSTNISKINAIGHSSLGGRVMMYLALEYPHLINSLIVVDISPVRTPSAINNLSSVLLDAMVPIKFENNKIPLSKVRMQVDEQLKEKIPDKTMRQFVLTNIAEGADGQYKWRVNLDTLVSTFPSMMDFELPNKTFEGPVLFIGGTNSTCLKEEDHKGILNYFPKAEFQYIQDAGHWLHIEKPTEFLDLVCNFLDRVSSE